MKLQISLFLFSFITILPSGFSIAMPDPFDRWHVRDFYNAVFPFGSDVEMGWTGNYGTGHAGSVSADWLEATRVRLNFYRALAGIPADVTFDPVLNTKAQQSALMMSINNELNHFPPQSWDFWTADGAEAAENGNLALGSTGMDAIEGYMMDFGSPNFPDSNAEVGHRRWLLFPQTSVMGSGDVPGIPNTTVQAANTVYVITEEFLDPRPPTTWEYVAWPPRGQVPSAVVYSRWSFGLPGADFSNATVEMTVNGSEIPVRIEELYNAAFGEIGDPTIVWVPNNMDTTGWATWPTPDPDEVVTVDIANVMVNGQNRSFNYAVFIFDASKAGPNEFPSQPVPFGPVISGHPAYFNTTARPWSEGIDWRILETEAYSTVLDAEGGVQPFETSISEGYPVLQDTRKASGQSAFHLANPDGTSQILTLPQEFLLFGDAELSFQSSLAFASVDQYAVVEINTGSGNSWQEIWRKQEEVQGNSSFESVEVDLGEFAGKTARFRFRYDLGGNLFYFPQTDPSVGWVFDNVTLEEAEELLAITASGTEPGSASLQTTFSATEQVFLQTRDRAFDGFALDWGPAHPVTPVTPDSILSAGESWENDPVFGFHQQVHPDWKYVRNIGWTHSGAFPWIYTGAGWFYYVTGSMADGLWLYNPEQGFAYTRLDYGDRFLVAPFDQTHWRPFLP